MFWTLLSCVLLVGILNALPTEIQNESDAERQKDLDLSMYVDAPRPYGPTNNRPPNSPSSSGAFTGFSAAFASAVIIQGWTATAVDGTANVPATDVYSCLNACRTKTSDSDPRCRFVNYNIETGICTKFSKKAVTYDAYKFSRNTDNIVAAFSEKRFVATPSTDYPGDDLAGISDIGTAENCKLFCHIVQTCNVVVFGNNGLCWLKNKVSLNGYNQPASSSFIA